MQAALQAVLAVQQWLARDGVVVLFSPMITDSRDKRYRPYREEAYMRCVVLVMLVSLLATAVAAQEEVLFKGDIARGGFGGPVLKYTSIRDQGALMIGGRGGWIINHALVIGGGGYGVFTEVNAPQGALPEEGPLDIEFGYGGFEMEYIFHPNSLTHLSIYALVGAGGNNFVKDVGSVLDSNEQAGESDFVLVLEPALNGELNVTKWFRLCGGLCYRLVNGVDQPKLDNSDFSGVAATLTFKFGSF